MVMASELLDTKAIDKMSEAEISAIADQFSRQGRDQ